MLITDLDKLRTNKSISAHDLDLGFYLKLYKEMKKINHVKIIGIPQQGDKEELKEQVTKLLKDNV
jgi:Ni,Fe-hydrogenase maturation factor